MLVSAMVRTYIRCPQVVSSDIASSFNRQTDHPAEAMTGIGPSDATITIEHQGGAWDSLSKWLQASEFAPPVEGFAPAWDRERHGCISGLDAPAFRLALDQ
jgi:hypothetical protein